MGNACVRMRPKQRETESRVRERDPWRHHLDAWIELNLWKNDPWTFQLNHSLHFLFLKELLELGFYPLQATSPVSPTPIAYSDWSPFSGPLLNP